VDHDDDRTCCGGWKGGDVDVCWYFDAVYCFVGKTKGGFEGYHRHWASLGHGRLV
jgi:hypothetical protein